MMALKSAFIKITLMGLSLTCVSSVAIGASTPLQKLCDQYEKTSAILTENEVAAIQQEIQSHTSQWKEDFCAAKPELILNNGALYVYRAKNTYIFSLVDRERKLRDFYSKVIEADFSIEQAAITMDDGIQIPTMIFKPKTKDQKSFPTILNRSPYLSKGLGFINKLNALNYGAIVVVQPARGTSLAPGEFEWLNWKQEAKDANATMNWISQQKWSDGNIYALGVSYDGFLALAAATTNHPHLRAVFAASAPWNPSADSLSANENGFPALRYTSGLNWDGNSRIGAIDTIAKQSNSYNEILAKARRTFGLQLESMGPDQLAKRSMDFVESLKKTTATMVYGFGYQDDQDSRDIINLAKHIQGMKNHYFVVHNLGHSDGVLLNMLGNMFDHKTMSSQDISQKLFTVFKSKNACAIYRKEKSLKVASCSNDLATIYSTQRLVVASDIPHSSQKGRVTLEWDHSGTLKLLGQRHIKFKITSEKSGVIVGVDTFSGSKESMGSDSQAGNPEIFKLKKGTHDYELWTQHEYFQPAHSDVIGVTIFAINPNKNKYDRDSAFTLESISYDLSVEK